MTDREYAGAIEAMLFASGEAVEAGELAAALETNKSTVRRIISALRERYDSEESGIKIIELGDSYQMCTSPNYYGFIENLGKAPKKKALTQALTETLAIVAYRQPITKPEIESIRGVSADHAVGKLLEFGLIKELGRAEAPGRPILFGTSEAFLRGFGISALSELPELPDLPEQTEIIADEG